MNTLKSIDGTVKFIWEGYEAVLIEHTTKFSVCISSQVGCPVKCSFCATGKMGFIRNLKSEEMINQVRVVREYFDKNYSGEKKLRTILFLGMGEPLLNQTAVKEAIFFFHNAWHYSKKNILVSTSGHPKMAEFF